MLITVLTTVLATLLTPTLPQIACEDCMDHLKLLEEEFIQDAAEADWERDYLKPTRQVGTR